MSIYTRFTKLKSRALRAGVLVAGIILLTLPACTKEENPEPRLSNIFPLVRSSVNQFLLPVKVGTQTFNLLVDSGSNALLVFGDKIQAANNGVRLTEVPVRKAYSSAEREGRLAFARVEIGDFIAPAMRIMVVENPDSQHDPSLTPKEADGIIGIRRTSGLELDLTEAKLDTPLKVLEPPVSSFELNLPKKGQATFTFNIMPILDNVDPAFLFRAKTLSLVDPENELKDSDSDLQVPFRISSSQTRLDEEGQDILLDTGAVSKLVLDTTLAEQLGYNAVTQEWDLEEDENLELNIDGPYSSLAIKPSFLPSEIRVEDYKSLEVEFEAVLGIDRWQNYVVGFNFVDFQSGGPDGTMIFLKRSDLEAASQVVGNSEDEDGRLVKLPGLNTLSDESYPSASRNAEKIAYQTNRPDGKGDWDINIYDRASQRVIAPAGLNSAADESDPSINAAGSLVVFHSNRKGTLGGEQDYDIFLYDLSAGQFVDLPGLNSAWLERTPAISGDGNFIAFRSERPVSETEECYADDKINCPSRVFLYDRTKKELVIEGITNEDPNFPGEALDPSLSRTGRYLLYEVNGTYQNASEGIHSDPYLYDTQTGNYLELPEGAATTSEERAMAVGPGGRFLAFTTNRNSPLLGLYDRDLVVFDLFTGLELFLPGLDTDFDEHGVQFSSDGGFLVFQSARPDGQGGQDVYLYNADGILNQ